jgi:putative thioredoxin
MSASNNIVEVSEANFEYEVIAFSQKAPVVVDFWAEWCVPCRTLGPLLEKLAEEGKGAFRLAKINVDSSPNLARRYSIRSIPAVKAFRDGQVVAEFIGVQPEHQLREFIRSISNQQMNLLLNKGQNLSQMHNWEAAEKCFRLYLEENPRQPAGSLGLVKCLIMQGKTQEAKELLRNFPDSKELNNAGFLNPLVQALIQLKEEKNEAEDALAAAYSNALRLVTRGNLFAAMDGILEILRQDKRYRAGQARQVMVALLELMGEDDPQTRLYRNEFASIVF